MLSCFKCFKNTSKSHGQDNVYVLDFSHHCLQDVPPEVFDFERTLSELNLGSNRISDLPPQLFLCHELKILWLNNNDIGNIPPAIGALSNLTILDLYRNNLMYSSIPDNIKQLKQLKYLNLSVNILDRLPDSITCLINLEELFLNDVALEYLQANFGRLVRLKVLELRDNRLVTLTKSMSRLKNLTRIDLGHNKFLDFPDVLCTFENLQELLIDENTIETLPQSIMNLRRLNYFDCSFNDILEVPREIQFLSRLLDLNLSGNSLRTLPKTIGGLSNLVTLRIDNNKLTKLPDVFGDMKNLEEMTLNDNFLVYLPPTIGRLRKLRFLTLDNNMIENLPQEIASCTALTILSVRANNLVELPPDIGHLTNLRVLNIVNNNLKYLPLSILNLTNLSALWISDNQSKPMMQLQKDHDGDLNFYLTCYMLPQCKSNRQDFNSESPDADLSSNNCHHTSQDYDTPRAQPAMAKTRRICFSNDSGIQIDRPGRLMRSPTPYPKELRTMAKSLNDNKSKRPQSIAELRFNDPTSTGIQIQIKEARISANVSTVAAKTPTQIVQNDESQETTSLLNASQIPLIKHNIHHHHHHHIPTVYNPSYNIQNSLEMSRNLFNAAPPQPNTDEFDSASSYCQSQIELNINSATIKNTSDYDMLSLNSSVSQEHLSNHHHLPQFIQPPMLLSNANHRRYNNQIYDNKSPSNHLYGNTQFIDQLNQHENGNLNPHHTLPPPPPPAPPPPVAPAPLPRVPPPYHIAKIHSKISQHDLIIYDSIRNHRNNVGNVYENTKELQLDPNYMRPRPSPDNCNYNISPSPHSEVLQPMDAVANDHELSTIIEENGSFEQRENINDNHQQQHSTNGGSNNGYKHSDGLVNDVDDDDDDEIEREIYENQQNHNRSHEIKVNSNHVLYNQHENNYESYHGNHATGFHRAYPYTNGRTHEEEEEDNNVQLCESPLPPFPPPPPPISDDETSPEPPPLPLAPPLMPQQNQISPTRPWLFGQHKNPTVIQFNVKRSSETNHIGFSLTEVQNNTGIFINNIEINCDAFEKLRIMDKVLDIDGYDFTRLAFNEANRLLTNVGLVASVMVSRR